MQSGWELVDEKLGLSPSSTHSYSTGRRKLKGPTRLAFLVIILGFSLVCWGGVAYLNLSAQSVFGERGFILSRNDDPAISVLQKTAFSSTLRLVFFAGLEGTGHHFFHNVALNCEGNGWCRSHCDLTTGFYPGLATSRTLDEYEGEIRKIEAALDQLQELERELEEQGNELEGPGGLVIPVNGLVNCRGLRTGLGTGKGSPGMMSFPNFWGPKKATQYVNMRLLAEMAEDKGLDLRIVYLQRDPQDILRSVNVNRPFGTYMAESRILTLNANAMWWMFLRMDSNFVDCFRYQVQDDPGQMARIAAFLSPNPLIAAKMESTMHSVYNFNRTVEKIPENTGQMEREASNHFNPTPTLARYRYENELKVALDMLETYSCPRPK